MQLTTVRFSSAQFQLLAEYDEHCLLLHDTGVVVDDEAGLCDGSTNTIENQHVAVDTSTRVSATYTNTVMALMVRQQPVNASASECVMWSERGTVVGRAWELGIVLLQESGQ